MPYDPAIHHRRSIRLKGHDYAGGGWYFVTICMREGRRDDTHVDLIAEEWERTGALRPYVQLDVYVVMPDHFHALIRLEPGHATLGNVVGAFKAAVTRATRIAPAPFWQRNYYERIIRDAKDLERVRRYIRMNPVRLIMELPAQGVCRGDMHVARTAGRMMQGRDAMQGRHACRPYRGMGNPGLWGWPKMAVFCSRRRGEMQGAGWKGDMHLARTGEGRDASRPYAWIGGFHSPGEKEVLEELVKRKERIIVVPPVDVECYRVPESLLESLGAGRLLVVSPFDAREFSRGGALERNRLVLELADEVFTPYIRPGGELENMLKEGGWLWEKKY